MALKHILRINQTEANIKANLKANQTAINTNAGSANNRTQWHLWGNSDMSLLFYPAVQKVFNTGTTTDEYQDATFNDMAALQNMYVADSIIRYGDTDTKIVGTADKWRITAGNVAVIDFEDDLVQGNPTGADIDFKWLDDAGSTLVHFDVGAKRVGIGRAPTTYELEVEGSIHAIKNHDGDTLIRVRNENTGSGAYCGLFCWNTNDLNIRLFQYSVNFAMTRGGQTATGMSLLNSNAANGLLINQEKDGPIYLGTNNLTRMTIAGNGKVGIGRTPTTYALEVNGIVHISGNDGLFIQQPGATDAINIRLEENDAFYQRVASATDYEFGYKDNGWYGNFISVFRYFTGDVDNRGVAIQGKFSVAKASTFSGDVIMANEKNLIFNTSTGTKIGTATNQKIGFWNVTPIVQPVLATGASKTVDEVITVLQNLGLCKQS
jgi:hypothetical protein